MFNIFNLRAEAMSKSFTPAATLAALFALSLIAGPAAADPGKGHGQGSHGAGEKHAGQGNPHADKHSHQGQNSAEQAGSALSYATARALAERYGATGYRALPPGIAKNVARGKPLPPGIAKKTLPAALVKELPYYPGYEWRAVGDNLVLIALSTAVVTAVLNGVFD